MYTCNIYTLKLLQGGQQATDPALALNYVKRKHCSNVAIMLWLGNLLTPQLCCINAACNTHYQAILSACDQSEALILLMQQQVCEIYIYVDLHFTISSLRNGQNNILSCKRCHLCKWHPWVSKLKHFVLYIIRSNCAKYQVLSFNTL